MTGTRRGFGNERHNHMKAVVSFVAGGSFLVAWIGFAATHGAPAASNAAPVAGTPTPAATAPPIAGRDGNFRRAVTPVPADPAPQTTPAPRPRTSRGS